MENDYRKYFRLVSRRRYLFAGVAMAVCTLGLLVTYLLPSRFEAQSTVFIEKGVINELFKGMAVTRSIEDRIEVLEATLRSRSLLQQVVKNLDEELVPQTPAGEEGLVGKFQRGTEVTVKDKDLFTITYADENPQLARDYVNTLVRTYINANLSASREDSTGASQFIGEQMEDYGRRLREAEARLADFRKNENFAVFGDETLLISDLRESQKDLDELSVRRNELTARLRLMNRGATRGGTAAEHLAQLQRRRDQLLLQYTERYPEVQLVEAEIAEIKKAIDRNAGRLQPEVQDESLEASMARIELEALERQEENLRRDVEEKKAILASIPEKRKVLNELTRERDTLKQTYDDLANRYGKSEVSMQMGMHDEAGIFRIVDPAILPKQASNANRIPFLLMSLAAGLGIALALVFALDYLDPSMRGIDSLQEIGLPVLALIPQFTSAEEQARERRRTKVLVTVVAVYLVAFSAVLALEYLQVPNTPAAEPLRQAVLQQPEPSIYSVEEGVS